LLRRLRLSPRQGPAQPAAPPPAQTAVRILEPEDITLEPGESHVLRGQNITRTSVSNPDIVDIIPVSTAEVLVNAKKEGIATVRIWDAKGTATYNFTVATIMPSPEEIAAEISEQIGIPTVSVRIVGDTAVLSGTVPNMETGQRAARIAEASGRKVLNLLAVESITPDKVVASLKAALPEAPLTYETLPDQTVMIRGTVASEEDARRIQDVVQAWIGTPEQVQTDRAPTTRINLVGDQQTPSDVIDKAHTIAKQVEPGEALVSEEFNFSRRVFGGRIANGPRIVAILEVNPALARQLLITAQVVEVDRVKLKTLGLQWGQVLGENATQSISNP
jgi:Flp pilus assembly secretin CpaC